MAENNNSNRIPSRPVFAPSYYQAFKCIAGDCTHSCCKGWEIDIDSESLSKYMSCPGKMGERLRENIEVDDGGEAHFRLTDEESCPFLNSDMLCDLFIEMGEDSLCQICKDHPRFRNYWSDRIEIGLGMACEEAARIILSWEDPVILCAMDKDQAAPDGSEETEAAGFVSDEERDLLTLRAQLAAILQDRSLRVDERIFQMLEYCGIEPPQTELVNGPLNEIACEQLAVYFLYRNYADALYDGRLEERIRFVADAYMKVRNKWASNGQTDVTLLVEAARQFSEEVEYDSDTWQM